MFAFSFSTPFVQPRWHRSPLRKVAQCTQRIAKMSASPDVVIIGGGVIGLSTALELAQVGAKVRVLVRNIKESAAKAAAGMLAPRAEALGGPFQDLGTISLELYPRFVETVQGLSGMDVRYISQDDFLLPLLEDRQRPVRPESRYIDRDTLRSVEPALGPAVVGALRLPGEAHVDNRVLVDALLAACRALHVDVCEGVSVQRLQIAASGRSVNAIVLENGELVRAGHFVAACGAWTGKLLKGVPVRPIKGQMLCVEPVPGHQRAAPMLQHVLYGEEIYIVPKNGGRQFFVGATIEEAGFSTTTTAGGTLTLLQAATRLVPSFADYRVTESWAGLRPGTPDKLPILGQSEYGNLSIATGTYRNGILLCPVAAQITAAFVLGQVHKLTQELQNLLPHFSQARFLGAQHQYPPSIFSPQSTETSDPVSLTNGRYHPAGTLSGNRVKNEQDLTPATQQSPTHSHHAQENEFSEILMWKVLPDGTKEPVEPSSRFKELRKKNRESLQQPKVPSPLTIPNLAKHQERNQANGHVSSNGVGGRSVIDTNGPKHAEIGKTDDAYEDVMKYRGTQAGDMESKALAANRGFGRTKSSLESPGETLSISREEELLYDAALQAGLDDMGEFEKHMAEDDPAARATQAEAARFGISLDDDEPPEKGPLWDYMSEPDTSPSSSGYF